MTFRRKHSLLVVGLLAVLGVLPVLGTGCLVQTQNSVSGDQQQFSGPPVGATQNFTVVSSIFRTNCAQCHATTIASYTEAQFVSNGLVVPGEPDQSMVFEKLKGANAGGSVVEDMPQTGNPLSASQIQSIEIWIAQMDVTPTPSPSSTPSASPSPGTLTPEGSPQFIAAWGVIQNECADCHSAPQTATSSAMTGQTVAAFGNFTNEGEFIEAGLIISNDPTGSWLIRALKSWGDLNLMPADDVAIPQSEADTMTGWISQIGQLPASPSPSPIVTPSPSPQPSVNASPSPSPSPTATGTLNAAGRLSAALTAIQNNCAGCHSSTKTASSTVNSGKTVAAFDSFTTESQFISAGLIVANDPTNSWLIQALVTWGPLNLMPPGGPTISQTDEETLTTWISQMGQP